MFWFEEEAAFEELCCKIPAIRPDGTFAKTVPPSEFTKLAAEDTFESVRKINFQEFKVPVFPVALSSMVMVQMPFALLPFKILRELSGR